MLTTMATLSGSGGTNSRGDDATKELSGHRSSSRVGRPEETRYSQKEPADLSLHDRNQSQRTKTRRVAAEEPGGLLAGKYEGWSRTIQITTGLSAGKEST